MKDDFTLSNRDKQGQQLHLFIGIIGLLALFAVAEYVTFGQIRVRRGGGRARGVRYGAGGSIRYGQHYSSGARYGDHFAHGARYGDHYARGARYRRASSGMLPSAGRYGYRTSGMGTIRYGGAPARYSVPVRPKIPTAVAIKPRPYTPAIAPKAYVPSRAYSAQGSIRYGAATSLSPKYVQQSKSLSPVGKKGFSLAPEIVLAKTPSTSLNIPTLAYSSGSIRYGRAASIAPKTSVSKSTIVPQTKQPKLPSKSPTNERSKNR